MHALPHTRFLATQKTQTLLAKTKSVQGRKPNNPHKVLPLFAYLHGYVGWKIWAKPWNLGISIVPDAALKQYSAAKASSRVFARVLRFAF